MTATMEKPKTNGKATTPPADTRPDPVRPDPVVQAEALRARLSELQAKAEHHAGQIEYLESEIGLFEDDAFGAAAEGNAKAEAAARQKIQQARAQIKQHQGDEVYTRRLLAVVEARVKDADKAAAVALQVQYRREIAPMVEELGRHLAAADAVNRRLYARLYELQGRPGFPGWVAFERWDATPFGVGSSPGMYDDWAEHVRDLGFNVEVPKRWLPK